MTNNSQNDNSIETGGAYEIIRQRLSQQGELLGTKLNALNQRRIEVFGSTQMSVIGQTRVRTENNCVPRDILNMGNYLLFGYNVFMGLKSETKVSDVFSLHTIEETADGYEFAPVPFEQCFLSESRFVSDFQELYRYYKEAKLSQLRNAQGKKLAVFQVGKTLQDAKVFRWAVDIAGNVSYIDNRGERDNVYPASHDFEWRMTTRESHIMGKCPHVSILDEVFVETVGGTLTVKLENNTEDGLGIYNEPVDDLNQSLADAQIHFAKLGELILLKIRPYREEKFRYLVFNKLTQKVTRIDAIGQACVQLPEDHGIIFPGGYYLKNGDYKVFEGDDLGNMRYKRLIRSPNGEDVLYIFHQAEIGKLVLFSYNLIRKEVQNPIICHGYSIFTDGRMVVFRADDSMPVRVHPMQIWQTPYMSDEHAAQVPKNGSFLGKIGNPELVRGISDAYSIKRMIEAQSPNMATYEQLLVSVQKTIDAYHWLGHADVGNLLAVLKEIQSNANLIRAEFEKVQTLQREAAKSIQEAETVQQTLIETIKHPERWQSIEEYVQYLTELRSQRGRLITLRDVRYIDLERVNVLETQVIDGFNQLSQKTVNFLLQDSALKPYHQALEQYLVQIPNLKNSIELKPLQENLDKTAAGLELLNTVLNDLSIEDPSMRTQIVEAISDVYAQLNRVRAELNLQRKNLSSHEAVSAFAAQFKLFSQNVAGAMAQADTPEKADEQLTRLLVQLEDLDSRFSEFDEFLAQIADKRDEVYASFEARKQALVEERQRRALHLNQTAERILQGIVRRAASFKTAEEQNAYFAADAMVLKVRDLIKQLYDLGDSVKAGDLESRLKSSRDQAVRELRDKQDIFVDDGAVILLGKHRFSVNTQALDLTLVPQEKDGEKRLALHLTGTDFFQALDDTELNANQTYWEQSLISESASVYRAEYLAYQCLRNPALKPALEPSALLDVIRHYATEHYDEGYERGVHDVDASLILAKLYDLQNTVGLLRFSPTCRAMAQLFWGFYPERVQCDLWTRSARSLQQLQTLFGTSGDSFMQQLASELQQAIVHFLTAQQLVVDAQQVALAGSYLVAELKQETLSFTVTGEALQQAETFLKALETRQQWAVFTADLQALHGHLAKQCALLNSWIIGVYQNTPLSTERVLEISAIVLNQLQGLNLQANTAQTQVMITGLLGQHPRLQNRQLILQLDTFLERLQQHETQIIPAYQAFRRLRQQVIDRERKNLRLQELKPQPLSSFVRNRLINEVYLPLIGDNFAKQLGTVGEQKRTDLMGLLLLISPPGYGKTTLLEYIAQRLGLIFVKINCPTIGHQVVSVDPAEAPSATARQELHKLNLALEMGNNVMLYLDDIQHSNPEFLQKFISLADGQRKIEGVWRGVSKTYDLRGKRFCIAMAGNPYTESGETFKIPDMLANRADIYNLGDVLGGKETLFALSYLENCLTSNPILAPLANREREDTYRLIRLAQGEEVNSSEFIHAYSATELQEITAIFRKLLHVQRILLKVNQQYIYSAAQKEAYRTEPAFKLQGSYRNMNKLAEKVVAVMNEQELQQLITDHYQGEAQTLTTGAEENLLKLAELRDGLSPEQQLRWEQIKGTFNRLKTSGDPDADPVTQVISQLSNLAAQLDNIRQTLLKAIQLQVNQSKIPVAFPINPEQISQLLNHLSTLPKVLQLLQSEKNTASTASTTHMEQLLQQLSTLPALTKAPQAAKVDVNVVNQLPQGAEQVIQQLVEMIESSLMPLVRGFERKSRLDLVIWNRLKDVSETLREIYPEAFKKARAQKHLPYADDRENM
ncbi:ATPase family protein associated with various cellular activities (AAA) [Beggiatoa alba B18LD]|uniref:ATPase family protein associated with various cellular activities (AAA) n=1 Tax=Beggiatoa alba B18LD TaxID=395493 RepID=I3CJ50_9GAMM|nr:DNA repair ATPase [Beggiatoa alba]EIJ43643.1 ATPase family protein associated with various cellular activities (AAA) [Beggiatoa alba B18LD]